jgi:hypothetical protein
VNQLLISNFQVFGLCCSESLESVKLILFSCCRMLFVQQKVKLGHTQGGIDRNDDDLMGWIRLTILAPILISDS